MSQALITALLAAVQSDPSLAASLAKALLVAKPDGKTKAHKKATSVPVAVVPAGRSQRSIKNEELTIRAFKRLGYKDVRPHENILTYGKTFEDGHVSGWLSKGRKVKVGEKAVKCGTLRLFHYDQTEPMVAETAPAVSEAKLATAAKTVIVAEVEATPLPTLHGSSFLPPLSDNTVLIPKTAMTGTAMAAAMAKAEKPYDKRAG